MEFQGIGASRGGGVVLAAILASSLDAKAELIFTKRLVSGCTSPKPRRLLSLAVKSRMKKK